MASHEAGHRRTWTPPRAPASFENDDLESANIDSQVASYVGQRLRGTRRDAYLDTPDLEGSEPQRKRRHIDSDGETSMADGQTTTNGPYFDAIRNTYTASATPVPLSQESLRALNSRPGQSSTRLRGWLRDSTQFSVGESRSNKHSVEYVLQDGSQEPSPTSRPLAPPPKEQHPCPNCKRLFNTKGELRHHARRYEKRPYNCDQCDKSFLYPKDLRRHKTTHDGSKSHQCTYCSKAFSRKDNLRRHMTNEHGGETGSNDDVLRNASLQKSGEAEQASDSRFEEHGSQQDSMRLLASVIEANQQMNNGSVVRPNVSTARETSRGEYAIKDYLVDPSMQPPEAQGPDGGLGGAAAVESEQRQGANTTPGPHTATRGAGQSSPNRSRNDVAIAQKALGWNDGDQARAAANPPNDVNPQRSNPTFQALEVS